VLLSSSDAHSFSPFGVHVRVCVFKAHPRYRRQQHIWTARDRAVMKLLQDLAPASIPINHPDVSGSIHESESVYLPILIETMFAHPTYGNVRVVAVLFHADTPEPDGITRRLGHFERMRSYGSRQSSRALFLHRIVLVEPLSSPLVLWCGEFFSSFNASAKSLGNHHQGGWVAWHLLKYSQLTMAVVMKEVGFRNHSLLINEQVPLSWNQPPSSFNLRDAMASQCNFECNEWNCQIPNKEDYSRGIDHNPELLQLFANGLYRCSKGNGTHSFTPDRPDGYYATLETCVANDLTYQPPVLKPRPIPTELTLSALGNSKNKADQRRYQLACFVAQFQYSPSSTEDFTVPPSALRLAIEFESNRGMGAAAYRSCLDYFMQSATTTFSKVMDTTPGNEFAYWSNLIIAPSELHALLRTWDVLHSTVHWRQGQLSRIRLTLRLKQFPAELLPGRIERHRSVGLSLAAYEEVCRFYLAAKPLSQFQLAQMLSRPMTPEVSTLMAFIASLPAMPSTLAPPPTAASPDLTIEDVSDAPAVGTLQDGSRPSAATATD